MVAVRVGFVGTSSLLASREFSWPSLTGSTPGSHRAGQHSRTPAQRRYRWRRVVSSPLRGRVDSAEAEELLAGLGYTVGSTNGQGRRRKRPPGNREKQREPAEGTDYSLNGSDPQGGDLDFLGNNNFSVSAEKCLFFERNGHVVTRNLFTKGQIRVLRPSVVEGFEAQEMAALRQKVSVWFGDETADSLTTVPELRARLRRIAPEEVPFLQVFNMFRKDGSYREVIEKLVLSRRLAHVASQLLGCSRVRIYQDSTFSKRSGDGPTRWHSDLNMAPLDCNDFVTAWIPLTAVPARRDGGSPLVFASRSHRDFALNHWQEERWQEDLTGRYAKIDYTPLSEGDVTWHHGWTLHSSPANSRSESRIAIAISYFRDGTRVLSKSARRAPDPEDRWSYGDWIDDTSPGDVLDHDAVPLVWTGA